MAQKRAGGIDQGLIRDLANILTETDLTEIEIEQEDMRIRVSRSPAAHFVHATPPAPMQTAAAGPSASAQAGAPEPAAPDSRDVVPSPMVGTVYLAPSPGARPFVEIGQNVKEGQTIMIIEAMKTMNQIPAPRAGTISQIMVEDGQPVEYGESLISIS